jgi:hypothetical protein
MNGRKVIPLLISTQVVLLAIVAWQANDIHHRKTSERLAARTEKPSSSSSTLQLETVAASGVAGALIETARTNATVYSPATGESLAWKRVESEDYRTYVKNLRAIGCPEQTVRDIVSADVIKAFGARRAEALSARYKDFQFWKADPADTEARSELDRQRESIDDEMRWTMHELLGADYVPPPASYEWRAADLDQRLSFLPDDKRQQTRDVLLQYSEVDQQVKALAGNDTVSEDPKNRLRVLDQYDQKRTALKQLLTPAEFEQVELAASWTAENLRHALVHFEPSQEEFVMLFNQWQPYDENLARLHAQGGYDPGNLQEPLYAKIRGLMTPERYQQFVATWWK